MGMEKRFMQPRDLILRAYAKRDGDVWYACCLDFSLAVQADTYEEAITALKEQIRLYVRDALVGEDTEHAHTLLTRKAPLSEWLVYGWIVALHKVSKFKQNLTAFRLPVPLNPCL
jgi:predicted RNase H-like HicB family nuclease